MIKIRILSSTPANDIVCLFWAHVHDSRMDSDWLSMSVSFISWNKNRSESYSNDIVSLCLYRYSRGVDSLILRTICRTISLSLSSLVWRGLLIGQFIIGVWLCSVWTGQAADLDRVCDREAFTQQNRVHDQSENTSVRVNFIILCLSTEPLNHVWSVLP